VEKVRMRATSILKASTPFYTLANIPTGTQGYEKNGNLLTS
jgi:hypothetical protein